MSRWTLGLPAGVIVAVISLTTIAQAGALNDIKQRGKMIVAIDPTFAPFEFTNAAGKVVGYDPSLIDAIAADWGVKVDYQIMAFGGIIPGLIAGSFDFSGSALNVTAERAKKINYTIPVAFSVNAVLKLKDNKAVKGSNIGDLSGLKCAVKQTSQPQQMMQALNEQLRSHGKAGVELLSFATVEETVSALVDKRVDCVVDDRSVLFRAMANRKDIPMEIVGDIGTKALIAWGTNKNDPDLTAALDKTLEKLKANGKMAEFQKKYFGFTMKNLPAANFIPTQ